MTDREGLGTPVYLYAGLFVEAAPFDRKLFIHNDST